MQFEKTVRGRIKPRNTLLMQSRKIVELLATGTSPGYCPLPERKIHAAALAQLQGTLYHFLAQLTPLILHQGGRIASNPSRDPRIARLVGELQSRPSIHPLPYSRWKQSVPLSRAQIDRLFRTEFGSSPRQLRDRYLLAAIKRQLMTRTVSVKETAASFGFSDTSHFCRWFRQQGNLSPEQFRLHGLG